jgi:hypothetical protein
VTRAARRAAAVALCACAFAACAPFRRDADVEAALRRRRLMVPAAGVRPEDVPDTFDEPRVGGRRRHHSLDIRAPRGTPVVSADAGTVLAVGASRLGGRSVYATDSERRFVYYYAHLDRHGPGLRAGTAVTRGQLLGEVGTTGNAPRTARTCLSPGPGGGAVAGRADRPAIPRRAGRDHQKAALVAGACGTPARVSPEPRTRIRLTRAQSRIETGRRARRHIQAARNVGRRACVPHSSRRLFDDDDGGRPLIARRERRTSRGRVLRHWPSRQRVTPSPRAWLGGSRRWRV